MLKRPVTADQVRAGARQNVAEGSCVGGGEPLGREPACGRARWSRRKDRQPQQLSNLRTRWMFRLGTFALGGVSVLVVQGVLFASELPQRLPSSCGDELSCRQLLATAQQELDQCWFACTQERRRVKAALQLLYRQEERASVRAYYVEREANERDEHQRLQRERSRVAEHRAVLQREAAQLARLELAQAKAQREHQESQAAHARRTLYLQHLSPRQRLRRLERCHELQETCQREIEMLVEAAADAKERRSLVELHERMLDQPALAVSPDAADVVGSVELVSN